MIGCLAILGFVAVAGFIYIFSPTAAGVFLLFMFGAWLGYHGRK